MLPLRPLMLLMVMAEVLCTRVFQPASGQVAMLSGPGTYDVDQANREIAIIQLKLRLLKALNLSAPPTVKTPLAHKFHLQTSNPRLFFLSSQEPDLQRPDVVSFRLSSCVAANIPDIDKVLLFFYVHPIQNLHLGFTNEGQPVWDRKKKQLYKLVEKNARLKRRLLRCKSHLKRVNKSDDQRVSIWGREHQSHNGSGYDNSYTEVDQSITADSSPENTTDRRQGRSESLGNAIFQRVKIVVRVINSTTHRKRNIDVQRMEVTTKRTVLVTIPIKYLQRVTAADDYTLNLQIVCRGCSRHAWIESVYKWRKHTKKNIAERMVNANRPILLIDMKNSTCVNQLWRNLIQDFDPITRQSDTTVLSQNASFGLQL